MSPEEYLEMRGMFRASSKRAFRVAVAACVAGFAVGAVVAYLVTDLPPL